MIISSTHDYRLAAKRRLPPFLFHYIDGARTTSTPWRAMWRICAIWRCGSGC